MVTVFNKLSKPHMLLCWVYIYVWLCMCYTATEESISPTALSVYQMLATFVGAWAHESRSQTYSVEKYVTVVAPPTHINF